MSKDTEIVRAIQIEDITVHVHIHLTEEEIRRLILPHVVSAFGSELRLRTPWYSTTSGDSTRSLSATEGG